MVSTQLAGVAAPVYSVVAPEQDPRIRGSLAERAVGRVPRHAVSFVLPAYNEELNIVEAVQNTLSVGRRYCSEFEVIVVDDGSTDSTGELVRELMANWPEVRLVQHGTNRGYGQALHTGFAAARLDYIFFTDADNQFDMDELPLLLRAAEGAEVVAGYRKIREDPPMRLLNAWAWNRMVRLLFYVPVRDIDCAFKLFRRSALTNVEIESRGAMINTEIMVKLARSGCRIVEVGVSHRPRTGGSPQGAKLRVIVRAFREVIHMYPWLTTLGGERRSGFELTGAYIDLSDDGEASEVPRVANGLDPLGGTDGGAARNDRRLESSRMD